MQVGTGNGMKGWLIRAQKTRSQRISCENRMNEARLSHLPFWGPSEAVLILINRPSG